MLDRRAFALGLALSAAPASALALSHGDTPLPTDSASVAAERDALHRLTVRVMVGEAGPFQFVVDCGADRSVLAADLAEALGLPSGAPVLVHGIVGAEMMETARAPSLTLGETRLAGGDLPVLPRDRIGADGLLGVEALKGRRLVMDFRRGQLSVGRSSSDLEPTENRGQAYVSARERFGLLTVVDARAAGGLVNVFVDSGGGVTVGNHALAEAVRRRGGWLDAAASTQLSGVTNHVAIGEVRVLDKLDLGRLSFDTIPMVISDLHVFDRWGLADRPTILLGANVLRLFARVELDYRRRRILFQAQADHGWRA